MTKFLIIKKYNLKVLLMDDRSCLPCVQVEDALHKLASVRCPDEMASPRSAGHFHDFETLTDHGERGERTSNVEPFCGRTSLKNPEFLFLASASRINAAVHPQVGSSQNLTRS